MLKKLASPKKKAQGGGSDVQDAAGFGLSSPKSSEKNEAKTKAPKEKRPSKEKPVKEKPKPKPPKEKKKDKAKKPNTDPFSVAEAATAEVPTGSGDAKETGQVDLPTTDVKTPSPRKSIARAFKRKTFFEQDNAPDEKVSAKKPLSSPKKTLMKLPKPDKKATLVDKKQEVKAVGETLDPSQEAPAATGKDPLSPPKADAAVESPKRKTRWKIPDRKHHSTKTSNNQKELKDGEESDLKSHKPPLSPTSDNNAPSSRENSPSPRVRSNKGKKGKSDKRQQSIDSSSGDSEQENQTNILSPLRRHKADPEDTLPIPESPYVPYQVRKRLAQLDVPPAYQPEVHLIGEIVSGRGFGTAGGLTCKWRVEYGSRWIHIAGDQSGQTQLDYPSTAPWTSDPDVAVWSHPIDLHFATSAFQGWPKLLFQVWRADSSMKLHVVGYGFVPVPFAAGQHKLWVSLWRPLGSAVEEIDAQILGRTPELKSDDVLFNAAWSERCRLRTVSTGKVLVHIGVLLRHFQTGVIEA
ncbi:hypothetical protein V7S43_007501 [Phytophthora oleae]|uniref:B9 domain-containing protein 2 n=1 Tax=Phytophthora oleae TaxID=2107226 RepID=A0ABD3FNT0_9STRA